MTQKRGSGDFADRIPTAVEHKSPPKQPKGIPVSRSDEPPGDFDGEDTGIFDEGPTNVRERGEFFEDEMPTDVRLRDGIITGDESDDEPWDE